MPWRDLNRAQADSWYGITSARLERELDLLEQLGMTMARFELPWALVAPDRPGLGRYDASAARDSDWSGYIWRETDRLIAACAQRGLEPVPQVVFSPRWASEGEPNDPPKDPAYFADFLRAAAERYRDAVGHWEIWNEPNLRRYWSGSLEQYARGLLAEARTALRDAGSPSKIVLGGLAGSDGLVEVLAAAGQSLDIASFHYYPPRRWTMLRGNVPSAVRRIRGELRQAGMETTPAWLTEVGAMALSAEPHDHMPVAGPRGQLRLLKSAVRRSGADAVFWYTLRDHRIYSGDVAVKRVYWGLFDERLQPRPAARWLAEFAQARRAEIT
jgi:hypothetical protein